VPVTINQEAAKLQNLLTRIAADVCQPTFATVDQMTRDSIRINHMKNDIDNRHDFVDADANLCVQEDLMLRPSTFKDLHEGQLQYLQRSKKEKIARRKEKEALAKDRQITKKFLSMQMALHFPHLMESRFILVYRPSRVPVEIFLFDREDSSYYNSYEHQYDIEKRYSIKSCVASVFGLALKSLKTVLQSIGEF